MKRRLLVLVAALVGAGSLLALPAGASHSWNGYHWARTANPFTLTVVDSNTSDWDDNLSAALADWSRSSVMELTRGGADDSTRARKQCRMVRGQIRSCNASYGNNGWLGLASINVSGGHITQGTAKMNDSYFSSPSYNETARQHVICQEIGHDFGLDHQDESGADLNTCMDYSNRLDNPSPNSHDYEQLVSIYSHLDGSTTISSVEVEALADLVPSWAPAAQRSRSVYVDKLEDGSELVTFVLWANPIRGWQ